MSDHPLSAAQFAAAQTQRAHAQYLTSQPGAGILHAGWHALLGGLRRRFPRQGPPSSGMPGEPPTAPIPPSSFAPGDDEPTVYHDRRSDPSARQNVGTNRDPVTRTGPPDTEAREGFSTRRRRR